jgi:hypothetical protein
MARREAAERRRSSVTHQTQACVSSRVSIPALAGAEGVALVLFLEDAAGESAGVAGAQGTSLATGRPRLVMITADFVRATSSSVLRQRSLNLPAAMVFMPPI